MSSRDSLLGAIVCVFLALSGYGCDDNRETEPRADRLGPSPISFDRFATQSAPTSSTDFYAHGITLQAGDIIPQLVPTAACPARPPFRAPITLIARGDADSDLFLNEVQMQFVDRTGRFGGSMVLAGSQLAERFGSTRIPPLGTRSFPVVFPFGCTGERAGTLNILVSTGDASGRRRSSSISARIH
jgi:hypothetical protein